MITKYPNLFESHSAKVTMLQKILNRLRQNVKEYESNYEACWYIGIAQEYFSLFTHECTLDYVDHAADCFCSYLDQMNYLSHPLTNTVQSSLTDLFPKIVTDLKKRKQPTQILKAYSLWNLRKIQIPPDKVARICLLFAYSQKGKELSKQDIEHVCLLLEDLAKETAESFTEEEATIAQNLIHHLKDPNVTKSLFILISKRTKDSKAILEFMLRFVQKLFRDNRSVDALSIYELPEFESKRGELSQQIFPLYVHPKASEEDLLKGFNLLKTYPNHPTNHWVLLLGFVSRKGSGNTLEMVWKEYNATVDVKLQPAERGQCWLYFLRGMKTVVSPLMQQTILAQDVIEAVYKVPGASSHAKDAMIAYLEAATNYARNAANESLGKRAIILKLIDKILSFRTNFLKRKDLTPKDKEVICDIVLDLNETKAKLDDRIDQATRLEVIVDVIPLLNPLQLTPSFIKYVQTHLQCPKNPPKILLSKASEAIKALTHSSANEEIFNTILNFCLSSEDVQLVKQVSEIVIVHLEKNFDLVRKKSLAVKSLAFRLLNHMTDKESKIITEVETVLTIYFHFLIKKELLTNAEDQKFIELWIQIKLNHLLIEEIRTEFTVPQDVLLTILENTLLLLNNRSWSPTIFKQLEEFYIMCVKKKAFRILFFTFALAEFYSFHNRGSKYEQFGKFLIPQDAVYQDATLERNPELKKKYPKAMCPATNFQADKSNEYCEKLTEYKIRYIEMFYRFFNTETDVYSKAAILDLLSEQFSVIAHVFHGLNAKSKEKVLKCVDEYVYLVSHESELFVPHAHIITHRTTHHIYMNMAVLLSDLIGIGAYNHCPQKMTEYFVYTGFPHIIKERFRNFNFDDKEIVLGIETLFKRFDKDIDFQARLLQEIPGSVYLKDHRLMLPVLIKFFERFPNFYTHHQYEYEMIMAAWIKVITLEIFQKTVSNQHMEFMQFLRSNVFNIEAVTFNIRYLLKYIMEQPIRERKKYFDEIVGACNFLRL